jgi:nucleoside-triphosphatase THEP1
MITAFTVTYIQGGDGNWLKGFEIGLKMNFRAAVVIVGFSVIGTELYNPRIRDFFSRTSFRQLPVALELAFESLPKIISELPDLKIIFKNPGLVMNAMLNSAEKRMNEIKNIKHGQVFIVTGEYDSGKTTYVKALIANLQEYKNRISGIYAEKNYFDGQVTGYELVNISTGQKHVFLERKKDDTHLLNNNAKLNIGHCDELHSKSGFIISEDTLQSGIEWLRAGLNSECDLIIIDEIGKWELKDQVWAGILTEILSTDRKYVLLVVRKSNLNDVIQKWNIKDPYIIEIEKTISEDFADHLRNILR